MVEIKDSLANIAIILHITHPIHDGMSPAKNTDPECGPSRQFVPYAKKKTKLDDIAARKTNTTASRLIHVNIYSLLAADASNEGDTNNHQKLSRHRYLYKA